MNTKNQILSLLASIAVAFSLVSCGGDDTAAAGGDGDYPLKTCVVSGEELGSMGEPVVVKHGDVTVKLCCKSCIEKFNAEPEKYVAKLKQ